MNAIQRTARIGLVGMLAAVLLPFLTACGDGDSDGGSEGASDVDLEVTLQETSGWSSEQPKPTSSTVTVGEGDSFDVHVLTGDLTITVLAVDDDGIRVRTSQPMAPLSDGGGISLRSDDDEFELSRGGEVSFSTPTMDAGTVVTLAER